MVYYYSLNKHVSVMLISLLAGREESFGSHHESVKSRHIMILGCWVGTRSRYTLVGIMTGHGSRREL